MAETGRTGMTSQELLSLLMQGGAGLAGGLAQGQQNKNQQAQNQQQMMDQKVQQMMAALQNAQQTGQNLQMNRQQMPQTQASLSPLGAEQTFLQRQRLMSTMLPEMANFRAAGPTDPGVRGAYTPNTNMLKGLNNPKLLEAYGDQATATSLADRRKMMAQINPEYQFSGLENFGLDPSFNQGVEESRMTAGANLKAYEAAQASLANQQTQLANQQMNQQVQAQPEKKGGGVKGFLGGVLKTAAPFAALIPGVGPVASIGLGAAAGALGNKMQGGGLVSGAVQGGIGAGIGEVGQSLAKGQGLNPFNNKALTSTAKLPMAGFAPTMTPQGTGNLASSNVGGYNPFPQGVSQQAPNMPTSGANRMASVMGVPQGTPRRSGCPTATMPAYQGQQRPPQLSAPGRPGGYNIGERSLVEDLFTPLTNVPSQVADGAANIIDQPTLPRTPYPIVNQANAMMKGGLAGMTQGLGDIADGFTSPFSLLTMGVGGPMTGGARAGIRGATKAMGQNTAIAGMNTASNAGRTARAAQFGQTYNAGVAAPNMNTGLNAKSVMNVLSGNALSPEQKAQFLARPEVQAIFKSLPTGGR